jgi:hypothetical protein
MCASEASCRHVNICVEEMMEVFDAVRVETGGSSSVGGGWRDAQLVRVRRCMSPCPSCVRVGTHKRERECVCVHSVGCEYACVQRSQRTNNPLTSTAAVVVSTGSFVPAATATATPTSTSSAATTTAAATPSTTSSSTSSSHSTVTSKATPPASPTAAATTTTTSPTTGSMSPWRRQKPE